MATTATLSKLELLPTELFYPIFDGVGRSDVAAVTRLLRCSRHLKARIEPMLYTRMEDVHGYAMRRAAIRGNTDAIRLIVSYDGSTGVALSPPWFSNITDNNNSLSSREALLQLALYLAFKHRHVEACKLLLELGARLDRVDVVDAAADDEEAWQKSLSSAQQQRQHKAQLRGLVSSIFSRAGIRAAPRLAHLFFEAGLDLQVKKAGQGPEIQQPLIRLIKFGAPTELIRFVLDERGADPNRVYNAVGCRPVECTSALSEAVLAKSPETCRLLLARGASIHGPAVGKATAKALHLPVFAAAHAMAVAQTAQDYESATAMMQLCLDSGADINQRAPLYGSPLPPRHRGLPGYGKVTGYAQHYEANVIHVFLDSLVLPTLRDDGRGAAAAAGDHANDNKSHNEEAVNQQPEIKILIDGLRYLFSHGASVLNASVLIASVLDASVLKAPRFGGTGCGSCRPSQDRYPYYDQPILWPLESFYGRARARNNGRSRGAYYCRPLPPLLLLLSKWGPRNYAQYGDSAAKKRLYSQQALADHAGCLALAQCLIKHDGGDDDGRYNSYINNFKSLLSTYTQGIGSGYPDLETDRLADRLVADVPYGDQGASEVLFHFVFSHPWNDVSACAPNAWTRAVVEKLVDQRGADINASFVNDTWFTGRHDGRLYPQPLLYHLFRPYGKIYHSISRGVFYDGAEEFLRLLLEKGADPEVPNAFQETLIDVLAIFFHDPVYNGGNQTPEKVVRRRQCVLKIMDILRGAVRKLHGKEIALPDLALPDTEEYVAVRSADEAKEL
ncbi:hypothetical protein QBC46DRAFT_131538 [Diplogelasinospora grovesii]|uniref:Uncharacterized protein n=1 Tax=Diplogelasinospora grovesii TaxID=303347 RepID=A0AAN6S9Q5_9PEZI|nr:hypothetical protein QBC46DRAFT_131538 [Diplogelasinospora grovesii]